MSETPVEAPGLRSRRWFGQGPVSFEHRARMMANGYDHADFVDKPVIAVVNTWSDLNLCHGTARELAEVVKRGVHQAGGFPVEVPVMSLGETLVKPTTMLYRNLLAMETEEVLGSHPIDGAVLIGGCDKTTPALLMGAISVDLPAIYVPVGFMLHGQWRDERLGAGTSAYRFGERLIAGEITWEDWQDVEHGYARSHGTCNVMGTASTMTSLAEALGMTIPGASSLAAVDARVRRLAAAAGRRVVEMVGEDLCPSALLTDDSFHNALVADAALGGSTNAAIHLPAIAGRAGVDVGLDDFDRTARQVPVLANVAPSGAYLMEDFQAAGGLRGLLATVREHLRPDARTVNGHTLGENIAGAEVFDREVIRPHDRPVAPRAIAVLRGNLAPDGAVIKPSAASPELLCHRGRAVTFESREHYEERAADPGFELDPSCVLVMKNAGPKGAPGMPEWGAIPVPFHLQVQGVKDMVRISDARMSGTSYGTVVLHVAPEAAVGGPLALVEDGDEIELDVEAGTLTLHVDDGELERRRAGWSPPEPHFERGYGAMFLDHITQANEGCDFDFLQGRSPGPNPTISY